MNKEGLSKLIDYELEWRRKQKTDREVILALYNKFKNQNLSYNEIIQRIIKEFLDIGFDEDYWKQKIERVLFSEGLVDKKSNVENEIEKATKLTRDEYKELLKTKDYSGIPLDDKYYVSPKKGEFWAQMHIRGILPEEYEDYKSKKIPLWKAIRNHSVHVDLRCSFAGMKRLFQLVLVEDSVDSYLKVMKGSVDSKTKQISKGLIIIKKSAEEPGERLKEKKEMLLDEAGAKKVANLIIESKSYFTEPGEVGATKDMFGYMGTIVLGDVKSGCMREDYKELFLYSKEGNTELWNGRFVVKAFKKPRMLWWVFKTKEPFASNPWCHIDKGNFTLKKSEDIKYHSKEEYSEWSNRKDEC